MYYYSCNFNKAFDCVDHRNFTTSFIVIKKFECSDAKNKALDLVSSYFCARNQIFLT